MDKTYRIGTRTSPLALKQVEEVLVGLRKFYPDFNPVRNFVLPGSTYDISNGVKAEIVGIDTYGDKDKATPISEIEGSDFFTREIDAALLKGIVDFAVHSAKDLPDEIPKGLVIVAITKSIDPFDALVLRQNSVPTLSVVEGLVSKNNLTLDELKVGAKIGASSNRRKTQLKKFRSDFKIMDIRGNIEERLERLKNNGLDAIVVAACALVRLGLEDRIVQRVPFEILKPHPLQGSLAIEIREDNNELINILKVLSNEA